MTGRITIEIDFSTGKSYIKVQGDRHSDDLRDKSIINFFEQFGHFSSWCKVHFNDNSLMIIEPVTADKVPEMSAEVKERLERRIAGEVFLAEDSRR